VTAGRYAARSDTRHYSHARLWGSNIAMCAESGTTTLFVGVFANVLAYEGGKWRFPPEATCPVVREAHFFEDQSSLTQGMETSNTEPPIHARLRTTISNECYT